MYKKVDRGADYRVACLGALLDLPESVAISSDGKQAWRTVRDFYAEKNLHNEFKFVETLFINRYNPVYGDSRKPRRVSMMVAIAGLVALASGCTMGALPVADSLRFLYGKYYHRYFEKKIA